MVRFNSQFVLEPLQQGEGMQIAVEGGIFSWTQCSNIRTITRHSLSRTLLTVAIHREAFVQRGGWGCLGLALFGCNVCMRTSCSCD